MFEKVWEIMGRYLKVWEVMGRLENMWEGMEMYGKL